MGKGKHDAHSQDVILEGAWGFESDSSGVKSKSRQNVTLSLDFPPSL